MPTFHKVYFGENYEGVRIFDTNIILFKKDVSPDDWTRLLELVEEDKKKLENDYKDYYKGENDHATTKE